MTSNQEVPKNYEEEIPSQVDLFEQETQESIWGKFLIEVVNTSYENEEEPT